MVPKRIEITRVENGIEKKYILRRFEDKDVHRIFMAWNNPQCYRYNSIDWNEDGVKDIVQTSWPSPWGMYFMVLEDAESGNILSTCRFGGDSSDKRDIEWDFGYSTFRGDDKEEYTLDDIRDVFKNGVHPDGLNWGKGYGSLMVEAIIKIAQEEGICRLTAGADGENWGSQKIMMKNGMTFFGVDKDGDVDLTIRLRDENGELLKVEKPTSEELKPIWESHMQMVTKIRRQPKLQQKIQDNDQNQLGKSFMFLLMNRASRIDKLIGKEQDLSEIQKLQQDMKNIYSQFTVEERQLFDKCFADYKSRWTERIGDKDFDQDDVRFNLNCCKIIDAEIAKINVSHV